MDRFHPSRLAEVASPRPLAIAIEPLRGRPEATVVLKLTFAPDERGVAALTPDQEPLFPAPLEGAYGGVAHPSDTGGPRAACDVLLVGAVSALGGPASFNLNERGWRAAHARGLGPLERLTDRGWAPFPQRIPFPRLPLTVTLASPGLNVGCALSGPEPFVAVAWEPHWQPVPLQLSIDRVALDVDRGRVTLTYRAPFALGAGRFLVLADPTPTPAFFEQARTWPRSACADLAELASRGAGPLLVPVAAVQPPAPTLGAPTPSAPPSGGLPFFGPPPSQPSGARAPLKTAQISRVAVPAALPFRSVEGARALIAPGAQPSAAPEPAPAPVQPPPPLPSTPRGPIAQPSYLREQAARQAAASASAAPVSAGAITTASEAAVTPREQTRIDGLTLEEIAEIRERLLRAPDDRRAVLKERQLTELKWKLIERRLAEHLRKLEARPADLVREVRALAGPRARKADEG